MAVEKMTFSELLFDLKVYIAAAKEEHEYHNDADAILLLELALSEAEDWLTGEEGGED